MSKSISEIVVRMKSDLDRLTKEAEAEQKFHTAEFFVGIIFSLLVAMVIALIVVANHH